LTDHLEVHRGSAISSVVANSVSTASGVLGILGLQLGWVWKQQLLQLCCPCDCGETSRWSIGAEARCLVGVSMDVMNEDPGTLDLTLNVLKATKNILTNLKALGQHTMHSDGQRQPSHGSRWQDLHNHWEMPFPSSHSGAECLRKQCTVNARADQIKGAAYGVASLLLDVYSLVLDWKSPHEG
ncbi:hypothetical protein A6R68_23666, partial [Neotoma lepida]